MDSRALTRAACLRLGVATTATLLIGNACDTDRDSDENATPGPDASGGASGEAAPDAAGATDLPPRGGISGGGHGGRAASGASGEAPHGSAGAPDGAAGDASNTGGGGGASGEAVNASGRGGAAEAGAGASVGGQGATAGTTTTGPACVTTVGLGGDFPHEHPLDVTWSDAVTGTARLYTLFGDHAHNLLVTADDFAKLRAGVPLELESSASAPGPHVHVVRVVCA